MLLMQVSTRADNPSSCSARASCSATTTVRQRSFDEDERVSRSRRVNAQNNISREPTSGSNFLTTEDSIIEVQQLRTLSAEIFKETH
jgi:hypothetical protein